MSKTPEQLNDLEDFLKSRILGQSPALAEITRVVSRCELGYTPKEEPMSSFLLLGPTGVGKTETCLVLAEFLYESRKRLLRVDMSEFMLESSVDLFLDRLDFLTRDHVSTGAIILFDEMEKAHPRILDLFLQLLSAARLTFGDHGTRDFSKFYIVFTSNLGSKKLTEIQNPNFPFTALEKRVIQFAQKSLRPEFFGRVKKKIVFRKLDTAVLRKVAKLHFEIETNRWNLKYSADCLELIIRKGMDIRYGARPLRGVIEDEIHNALAGARFAGKEEAGTLIVEDRSLVVA